MATTGTYAYNPPTGRLILQAYRRLGVPRAAVDTDLMQDALDEANLLMVEWANRGPQLWTVDTQTITLVSGTSTYTVETNTVDILEAWTSTLRDDGSYQDRQLTSISRAEYAAYANKSIEAQPSSYWFQRLVAPQITLYPVPDGTNTYLKFTRFRRLQDVDVPGGLNADLQYLWLAAFVDGLAAKLAVIHAPDKAEALLGIAERSFTIASEQNTEKAQLYITPQLGSYFR